MSDEIVQNEVKRLIEQQALQLAAAIPAMVIYLDDDGHICYETQAGRGFRCKIELIKR